MFVFDALRPDQYSPFEQYTFPYYRSLLRAPAPGLVAIGATLVREPAGMALARAAADGTAEILSVAVRPAHRRLGLGTELMRRLESELVERSVREVYLRYMSGSSSVPAIEGILNRCGWSPARPRMIVYRATLETMIKAPWVQLCHLPAGFEVFAWTDLTAGDADRLRAANWYPKILSPFREGEEPEPHTSVGLRYKGEAVGWMLTQALPGGVLSYSRFFVRSEFQRTGRAFCMPAESLRRQYRYLRTTVPYGVWNIELDNKPMVLFAQRRLVPYSYSTSITMHARKSLIPAGPDPVS